MKTLSKAQTLLKLKSLKVPGIHVVDIHVFGVREYLEQPENVLQAIGSKFSPRKIIVRSSGLHEDTQSHSMAGAFCSVLDVSAASRVELVTAIGKVIDSYKRYPQWKDNEVLIQPLIDSVAVSGVVLTRNIGNNAPYYIINYDDRSGKTDTVTGGRSAQLVCIFRLAQINRDNRWYALIKGLKRIEKCFGNRTLDIEFAITKDMRIVVFQVRLLAANNSVSIPDQAHVKHLIQSMQDKFKRFAARVPHLGGDSTVFTDMSDWNPAEIIGSRPNTLDYSLYSFLVMDEAWHVARTALGYTDVFPGDLMISFGKRPFVNTRLSFNSFIPADIPFALRDKLVNFYLEKLRNNPEKQDKIEFEIVWTAYNFSLEKETQVLKKHGFSAKEIEQLTKSLRHFTSRVIENAEAILEENMALVYRLTEIKEKVINTKINTGSPWDLFNLAYNLFQNCKKYGILPFAIMARLAFIGKSILISAKEENLIRKDFYYGFLGSVETILTRFNKDLNSFCGGRLSGGDFFRSYGHLRPGTYDITAPRYDSVKEIFADIHTGALTKMKYRRPSLVLSTQEKRDIERRLKKDGICADAAQLFNFISKAIEYREFSKFEFTKTLSEALELTARAGSLLGFSREELSHVDFLTLMKLRNPEYSDVAYAKRIIRQSIERHSKERQWSDVLIMPSVVSGERDFEIIPTYTSRPNFITVKNVSATVCIIDKKGIFKKDSFRGSIVVLENADPGFDWVFAKNPAGIITKYGGVASHMAIRCAELGLPAAIGCGNSLYEAVLKSRKVLIDCAKQNIEILQ
jgi:glutamine kinase